MKRTSTHISYIHSQMIKGFLAITIVLVPIHSYLILVTLPAQRGAGIFMSPLSPILGMTSTLYAFIIIQVAYSFAGDLSEGRAQLFLSHPLGKVEYVFSWLFTNLYTTMLLFILSIVLPVVVLDPTLLLELGLRDIYLLSLELVVSGVILFSIALFTKSRGITFLSGILLYYILPFILLIVISFITYVTRSPGLPQTPLLWAYTILYPYKSMLLLSTRQVSGFSPIQASISSLILASLLHVSVGIYSRRRLEVK